MNPRIVLNALMRCLRAAVSLAILPLLLLCTVCWATLSSADTVAGELTGADVKAAASPTTADQSSELDRRLAAQGLARGAPVLIRIFKEESELELWMQSGDRFKRFATFPICRWRGVLGPKLIEGDRQSPEGFYSFGQDQLLWQGHWFRAFNINYPNTLDRALGHTGSGILIHGACSSIGCYAMTDPLIDQIFDLVVAAFAAGQSRVQVHIFPFHMTLANLSRHEQSPWSEFWRDLKPASDLFVSTQVPPKIGVCDGRYVVKPGQPGEPAIDRIVSWCEAMPGHESADRLPGWLEARRVDAAPPAVVASAKPPSDRILLYARLSREGKIPKPQPLASRPASFGPSPEIPAADKAKQADSALAALPAAEQAALLGKRVFVPTGSAVAGALAPAESIFSCNPSLAACRHFMATHAQGVVAGHGPKTKLAKK